jgi:hypothetical protein
VSPADTELQLLLSLFPKVQFRKLIDIPLVIACHFLAFELLFEELFVKV